MDIKKAVQEYASLRARRQVLDEMREKLSDQIDKFEEQKQREIAEERICPVSAAAQIYLLASEYEKLAGGRLKSQLVDKFTKVFTKMSSKTLVIAPKIENANSYSGACAITVGEYGFGFRHRYQSRPLQGWSGLSLLLQRKDAVIAGLKEHKFLAKWAEKFKKFADMLEGLNTSEQMSISSLKFPLRKKVAVSKYHSVKMADAVSFNAERETKLIVGFSGKDENGETWNADRSLYIPVNGEPFDDWKQVVLYSEIAEELPMLLQQLEIVLKPMMDKMKVVTDEIEDSFGRELLIAEV